MWRPPKNRESKTWFMSPLHNKYNVLSTPFTPSLPFSPLFVLFSPFSISVHLSQISIEGVDLWGLAWWRVWVWVCGDQRLWWTSAFVFKVEVWVTMVAGLWNRWLGYGNRWLGCGNRWLGCGMRWQNGTSCHEMTLFPWSSSGVASPSPSWSNRREPSSGSRKI